MIAKCVAAGVAAAVLMVGAPVASAKDTNTGSDRSSSSSSQSSPQSRKSPSEKVATRNPGANRITKDQARQIIREQGRQRVCSHFGLSCP